uniref:Uncharacterized protein n=1 Tax=Chaetoceros debilis TaxID=122233 RepID=A0A7S3PY61_9STRA
MLHDSDKLQERSHKIQLKQFISYSFGLQKENTDMTNSSNKSVEPEIAVIEFGLFSSKKLLVSLHKLKPSPTSLSENPHSVVQKLDCLPSNEKHQRISLVDASRIISLDHIAIAANTAMIRMSHYENIDSNTPNNNNGAMNKRGLALETVICAAGSTNVGSIMKDFAFDARSSAALSLQNGSLDDDEYTILLLSYDCSEKEHLETISQVGLTAPEKIQDMIQYFDRERGQQEVTALMKVFKVTAQEVSRDGSSLEKAVLNRVATKFYT